MKIVAPFCVICFLLKNFCFSFFLLQKFTPFWKNCWFWEQLNYLEILAPILEKLIYFGKFCSIFESCSSAWRFFFLFWRFLLLEIVFSFFLLLKNCMFNENCQKPHIDSLLEKSQWGEVHESSRWKILSYRNRPFLIENCCQRSISCACFWSNVTLHSMCFCFLFCDVVRTEYRFFGCNWPFWSKITNFVH